MVNQVVLDEGEWLCEKWTLKNKLPDYRWDAWGEKNDKAYDDYWKDRFKSNSYDYNSKYSPWTWRFWDETMHRLTYWGKWKRSQNQCDKDWAHWK